MLCFGLDGGEEGGGGGAGGGGGGGWVSGGAAGFGVWDVMIVSGFGVHIPTRSACVRACVRVTTGL